MECGAWWCWLRKKNNKNVVEVVEKIIEMWRWETIEM